MIIRSVVPKNDDVVSGAKSTQHIVGINNLCVDVLLDLYFDGNVVQLKPCKSNGDVNQQWSLEKDGTIQSNGMCLATNGTSPGSDVFIYDCNKVKASATIWKVQKDGSILNPSSSLVLTSKSGKVAPYSPWKPMFMPWAKVGISPVFQNHHQSPLSGFGAPAWNLTNMSQS
jgi:hypothetical protein